VQLVLKYKKRRALSYKIKHPDFPLRRFISHPSGTKLSGYWAKGKSNRYPYYFFKKEKLIFPKHVLETIFKNFLSLFEIKDEHFDLFRDRIRENLVLKNEDNAKKARELRKHIGELKIKQTGLIQKNLQGIINDQILQEQLILVDEELLRANSSLAFLPEDTVPYDSLLEKYAPFIKNPADVWEKLPFAEKLKLQVFYFPKGIIFDGSICRTPEICKIFKAKTLILESLSPEVDLRNQNKNTAYVPRSHITDPSWEDIGKGLVDLDEFHNKDPEENAVPLYERLRGSEVQQE